MAQVTGFLSLVPECKTCTPLLPEKYQTAAIIPFVTKSTGTWSPIFSGFPLAEFKNPRPLNNANKYSYINV